MTSTSTYVFDNAWTEERERLSLLEQGWDAVSIRALGAVGVAQGWRCLDVGAGGASIASWLCERVGTTGNVVATDLDARFIQALTHENLEARAHDIVNDDLEANAYDLVHTRLVLEHIPERERALDRMIAALKPGGVLLLEEFDHLTFAPTPEAPTEFREVWSKFAAAFEALAAQRGLDLAYGSRMLDALETRGLADVQSTGTTQVQRGGSALSRVLALSAEKMRGGLVATGHVDDETLDTFVRLLHDPSCRWTSQLMVIARARRP